MSTEHRRRPSRAVEDPGTPDLWLTSCHDTGHRLVGLFAAFGRAYAGWLSSVAGDSGLSYSRLRLLRVLHCRGPLVMTGLREQLGITARSVTSLVDALEEDGLVARRRHPTDRRATIIELTDQGKTTMTGLFEAHTERAAQLFAELSEDEQAELARLMTRLTERLEEITVGR